MARASERHEVTRKRVLYDRPGTGQVVIRYGVEYGPTDVGARMDLYFPSGWSEGMSAPAVLFISGLSDIGAMGVLGCRINEMESFVSWARLVAASGLIGITYTTGVDPAADTLHVIRHLQASGAGLGIDTTRLGLWAGSSHVPNALGLLMEQPRSFRCAVLCYGFMLDLDGSTDMADAQRLWRFANPSAGKTVDDLPVDVPLFIVRAGQDTNPHLNESIDRFISHALRRNLPVAFVNHREGPHAFELEDDSDATRAIVRDILAFFESRLRAGK